MSYAIKNSDGEHLGFILMAGGSDAGDCIFRSLPTKSEIMNSFPSQFLFNLQQQGEFAWKITNEGIEICSANGSVIASIKNQLLIFGELQLEVVKLGAA